MKEIKEKDVQGPVLEVKGLKTYYSAPDRTVKAVDGVSFSLESGSSLGIAGESGSGKTQTALSIMGLIRDAPGIVEGEIFIQGNNLLHGLHPHMAETASNGLSTRGHLSWKSGFEERMREIRGSVISMVFQEPKSALVPYHSARDHFFETLNHLRNIESNVDKEAYAVEALQQMHFSEPKQTLAQYPHQLSGGETQRVMIALSMVGNPKILIADEPTTALDAVTQRAVIEQLNAAVVQRNMSMLFISHNLALLGHLVESLAVMFAGKMIEYAPTTDIISRNSQALHPYTKELLGAFLSDTDRRSSMEDGGPIDAREHHSGCVYYYRCTLKHKLSSVEQKRCESEQPPLKAIEARHMVACWAHAQT